MTSMKLTPAHATSTAICPGPGSGTRTSATCVALASGAARSKTTARITPTALDGPLGQHPQRGHARAEQILASARGDEPRLRLEEVRRAALDGHLALRAVRLADQEVLVR